MTFQVDRKETSRIYMCVYEEVLFLWGQYLFNINIAEIGIEYS